MKCNSVTRTIITPAQIALHFRYVLDYYLFDKAILNCNTSDEQWLQFRTASDNESLNAPTNRLLSEWLGFMQDVVFVLIAYPYWEEFSSFSIEYGNGGIILYTYNTLINLGMNDSVSSVIGAEAWELDFSWNTGFSTGGTTVLIYGPDGSFTNATDFPPCTVNATCSLVNDPNTKFWQGIGLFFQTRYWLYLADFGQIYSTFYPGNTFQRNFSDSWNLPSINNLFVNSSLYDTTNNTLITGLMGNIEQVIYAPPEFNSTNGVPLQQNNSVIINQSYYCQQRKLKGWLNLFLSIAVADYALIFGGYALVVLMASWLQKRREAGIH